MYGYIYKTTNKVNGKIYVGQKKSKKFLSKKYLGSGIELANAINKYGEENFEVELLEAVNSSEELDAREIYWIESLNSRDRSIGYNIARGGDGGDTLSHLSPEALKTCKQRMSSSHKGRKMSQETKDKLSAINKGKYYLTEESKEKGRQKLLGRVQSEEEKEKKRQARRRFLENNPTFMKEVVGAKISEAKKGKVVISKEQRKQISSTLKEYFKTHKPYIVGKHHTEEAKIKISLCHKGRIVINNGTSDKQIHPNELQSYLESGWKIGRINKNHFKRVICIETKKVYYTDELASMMGVRVDNVRYHVRKKTPIKGLHFEYLL